jgi:hypothetical protein
MSSKYAVVAGFIQYDPEYRQANDQPVRDIKVRAIGSQAMVRITVWPELDHVPLVKGDFVAVEGRCRKTTRAAEDGSVKEYFDVDAQSLARVASATRPRTLRRETQETPAGSLP